MAIGATGVGKSTLMNAIIQGVENMELNDDCNVQAKKTLYGTKDEILFEIGHQTTSCTRMPGFYLHEDIYFLDCPGIEDQDKTREYPNQTAVHFV